MSTPSLSSFYLAKHQLLNTFTTSCHRRLNKVSIAITAWIYERLCGLGTLVRCYNTLVWICVDLCGTMIYCVPTWSCNAHVPMTWVHLPVRTSGARARVSLVTGSVRTCWPTDLSLVYKVSVLILYTRCISYCPSKTGFINSRNPAHFQEK